MDATPIYAIRPEGAFARDGYDRLRQVVRDYMDGAIERISVAGVIVGQTQLMSGQIVPVVRPDLRCLYSWTTNALVESIAGSAPADSASKRDRDTYAERSGAVQNFLERVYEDVRNLGLLPQHRALNYAATNALNAAKVFDSALQEQMQLDTVDVERSAICPLGEDCWDVRLTYFNPSRQFEQARKVYKFTVSVTEPCPVMIGGVRSWYVR
jgi:cyanobactin maturation PatA/PatG family protease